MQFHRELSPFLRLESNLLSIHNKLYSFGFGSVLKVKIYTKTMEFGELVEPDTRAFWGNYDEFDEENSQPGPVSWKWMDEDASEANVVPFKRLFIIEGHEILSFVQTTILKQLNPVCQIDGYKTSVYKIPTTGDYICVSEDNDLDQSAKTTELLSPWLKKAEKTYLISFKSAYTYNTDQEFDKRCFIRTISNTKPDVEFDGIAPMEDSNIVYGVSAGAATWRQINKMPFTCYAVYMDCMHVDSLVAAMVLKLLNKLELSCDTNYIVKKVNQSNLYM